VGAAGPLEKASLATQMWPLSAWSDIFGGGAARLRQWCVVSFCRGFGRRLAHTSLSREKSSNFHRRANRRPHPAYKDQKRRLNENALKGVELVQGVRRLCAMNLMLHGIGGWRRANRGQRLTQGGSGRALRHLLTNPPFGKKSSFTVVGENGEASRRKRPTSATTSGPPPRTSSSTSCSTSRRC